MNIGSAIAQSSGNLIWGMDRPALIYSIASSVVFFLAGWWINQYYANKGIRTQQPLWCSWSATLAERFSTKNSRCYITYDGRAFDSVSISWIMLWNNGRATLEADDLDPKDRFRIEATRQATILDAKVVAVSTASSGATITVSPDGSQADIGFDLLRYREGVLFQITHSGSSPVFLELVGRLKEHEQLRRVSVSFSRYRSLPSHVSVRTTQRQLPIRLHGDALLPQPSGR